MILDSLLQFDNAVSLAIAAGTQASTNVLDLGIGATATTGIPLSGAGGGARDIGIANNGAGMRLLVLVTTSFASAASAGTLSVALQGAVDNASGAAAAFSTWYVSPVYANAALAAGTRLLDMDMPRPPSGIAIPRFLRLLFTVAAATMTAGNVSSYLVGNRDDQAYQSTVNSVLGGYPPGIAIAN